MYTSFRSIYKAPIRIKHDTIDDAEILTNTVLVKSHYKVKLVNILIRPTLRNLINN